MPKAADLVTVLALRPDPAYTTAEVVRREMPPRLRNEDVTDEEVAEAITTQANRLDMALLRYYKLPAPLLAPPGRPPADPEEMGYFPSELERINRFWAVGELMIGLFDMRQEEDAKPRDWWGSQGNAALKLLQTGDSFLAYPFRHPDGRPYFLPLAPGSPLYATHPLSASRRVVTNYPERTFEAGLNAGRRRRWMP